MTPTRRRFLEHVVSGAALSAAAPVLASAATPAAAQGTGRKPGAGPYDYLGRPHGYKDWAVVPRGMATAQSL